MEKTTEKYPPTESERLDALALQLYSQICDEDGRIDQVRMEQVLEEQCRGLNGMEARFVNAHLHLRFVEIDRARDDSRRATAKRLAMQALRHPSE